jgi:hypothetical protein
MRYEVRRPSNRSILWRKYILFSFPFWSPSLFRVDARSFLIFWWALQAVIGFCFNKREYIPIKINLCVIDEILFRETSCISFQSCVSDAGTLTAVTGSCSSALSLSKVATHLWQAITIWIDDDVGPTNRVENWSSVCIAQNWFDCLQASDDSDRQLISFTANFTPWLSYLLKGGEDLKNHWADSALHAMLSFLHS